MSYTPQSSNEVVVFTTTERLAEGARLPKLQLSWLPTIVQGSPTGWETIVQPPTPGAGRVSLRVTFSADDEPVLLTLIVKAASCPALIVWLSGVLSTLRVVRASLVKVQ